MERGTGDQITGWGAVKDISNQGISQRIGVHANLVRPARARRGFQQTTCFVPLKDFEMRFGFFPPGVVDNGPMAVSYVYAKRVAGGMFIPFWDSVAKGVV
jgi:hypothetical protein